MWPVAGAEPAGGSPTCSPRTTAVAIGLGRGCRPRFSVERPFSPDHLSTSPRSRVFSWILLAWLAGKAPTLGQLMPAIHGDSTQTKGSVLLSISSSSFPHRLEHLNHTFHFRPPAPGMSTFRSQPGGNTQTHNTRCTFDAVHS